MRIESAPYVVDLTRTQALSSGSSQPVPTAGSTQPSRARSLDRVEISPQARELQRLKQDVAALPDVRLDRVALAKQNLQYGGYRVDPKLLAQNMMDSLDSRYLKGDAI